MGFFTQVSNRISYGMHALSYDPEAERFAKEKAAADARAAEEETRAAAKKAKAEKEKQAEAERAAKQAELDADQKRRERFEPKRLFNQILSIVGKILGAFVLIAAVGYGASLASNAMVYRNAAFRIAAAIYGGIFFFLVIPYMLLYRWWWLETPPRYFAFLPIVPYEWLHPWTARLLSWMSYNPIGADALAPAPKAL